MTATVTGNSDVKSGRGGWRPGSGAKNRLGETERRDVRLDTGLIDLALRVGEGNFASGVRILLTEGARIRAHNVGDGVLPPTGEDLLAMCNGAWRVFQAKIETGGKLIFVNVATGEPETVTRWRLMPQDIVE